MSNLTDSSVASTAARLLHRREVLLRTAGAASLATAATMIGPRAAWAAAPVQDDWAQCVNCHMLFFNGDRNRKGRCAAPGQTGHVGERGDFKKYQVTHDDPTGPGQGEWRFCRKCSVLFFNGSPEKGVCAGGGGHEAAGFNFFLFHDRRPFSDEEGNWHFCAKCHGLFTTSVAQAGCPADGKGHVTPPTAFKFVVGKKAATL
jgi:hypothetical protein